jgi:heat shock protein HslJ
LANTKWLLTRLSDRAPVESNRVTLEFSGDGKVSGSAGCNSYSGTFEEDGTKLAISQVAVTLMACQEPTGIMEQEIAFLNALAAVQGYRIGGGQLALQDAGGQELLVFSRQ